MSFSKKLSQRNRGHEPNREPKTPSPSSPSVLEPRPSVTANNRQLNEDMIGGRFEVVDVRAGGMGVVYLCLDHQRDIPVALKTFKPEYLPDRAARDRFLREGTVWVDLGRHPYIVRCFEVFAPGIGPEVYFVLELIAPAPDKADASLRAWLGHGQPLSGRQAMLFALHIVRGMRHATAKKPGLVHRDLKPENVLVGPDGTARITDFGLASLLSQLDVRPQETVTSGETLNRTHLTQDFVGTPFYMPPEQWVAGEVLDSRADIYAVGCILYEMLTAKTAVSGRDLAELELAHRLGHIREMPSAVPRELADLVHRCMTPDREKRYQTWEQLEAALERAYRAVAGEDVPTAPRVEDEVAEERVAAAWSYQVIGTSYLAIGKYDVAQRYFRKGVQTGQEERNQWLEAAGFHNLALAHLHKGDAAAAVELLENALSIAREIGWTEEGAILAKLGNAYRDLGNMQEALEYYELALARTRAIDDRKNIGAILNSMGNLHRRSGRLTEAISLYEQALQIAEEVGDRSGAAMILAHLGICYRRQQETPRAIALFERALDISREVGDREGEGRALGNLANAYSDLGDVRRSIEYSQQGLAIAQETGNRRAEGIALGNLGLAYQNLKDSQQAIQYCERSLAICRDIGDVLGSARTGLTLAIALSESKKIPEALQHAELSLQAAVQIGNEQLAAGARELIEQIRQRSKHNEHWEKGVAYANNGRWDEAIQEYQAALSLSPDNAAIHYNLGVAYLTKGLCEKAVPEFETALRLFPDFPEARSGLGNAHYDLADEYNKRGQLQDAIREYQAAISIDPDNVVAHLDLGIALAGLGHFEHAVEEYHAALRLQPSLAKAHDGLGMVFSQLGQLADAASEFQQAVEVDPHYAGAHFNLAGLYWQQDRPHDAIREYQIALDLDPADIQAHCNLGMVYAGQNQYREATDELKTAIRIGPEDANLHYCLGVVYREQGLQSEAIREFQTVLRIDPQHADARLNLAGYHMQQGHLDDAIREYHAVLKVNPDYVQVHYNLGLAYYNRGRIAEAIAEFRLAARSGFEPAQRALARLGQR